jgi:hypothetical protein
MKKQRFVGLTAIVMRMVLIQCFLTFFLTSFAYEHYADAQGHTGQSGNAVHRQGATERSIHYTKEPDRGPVRVQLQNHRGGPEGFH